MLSNQKFFGGAYRHTSALQVYGVPQRVVDVSSASGGVFRLPGRTGKRPGAPYFVLINPGAGAVTVQDEAGATLKTLAVGQACTVGLAPTRWVAWTSTLNVSRFFGSNGASVRTVAVGYVPEEDAVVEPTEYDPILCDGAYRRARNCGAGTLANLWMTDADATPHFVDGVAAFKYQGVCYYFKESDRLLSGYGTLIDDGAVTWLVSCDECIPDTPPPTDPPPPDDPGGTDPPPPPPDPSAGECLTAAEMDEAGCPASKTVSVTANGNGMAALCYPGPVTVTRAPGSAVYSGNGVETGSGIALRCLLRSDGTFAWQVQLQYGYGGSFGRTYYEKDSTGACPPSGSYDWTYTDPYGDVNFQPATVSVS